MNSRSKPYWLKILALGILLLEGLLLSIPTSVSRADSRHDEIEQSATPAPAEATALYTPTISVPTGVEAELPDAIFRDGFESGTCGSWSATQPGSGDLNIATAAALVGTFGMQIRLNDNALVYVGDDLPNREALYRARFYFDPNATAMAANDSFFLLMGYQGSTDAIFGLELNYQSGYRLRLALRDDPSVGVTSNWISLSDTPHYLEIAWMAATAPGANNGGMTLWVDGIQQAGLANVDNDTWRLDRVQLGAVNGLDSGTRGNLYFDAFESRRTTYIGPETGVAPTPTNTPVAPTPTYTSTAVPPTPTRTNTTAPFTPTRTNTSLPPTAVYTNTPLPVTPTRTPTRTNTSLPPTATRTPTPFVTFSPTPSAPATSSSEWAQDAHDAQRSGYSPVEPLESWNLLWTWNGPDANGGTGNHLYNAPREARTVTGGAYIYVPAGSNGLYALRKTDGSVAWRLTLTSFNATPAYDLASGFLYAGGANGSFYKISTATGAVSATYAAGGPLNKSVLLADGFAYVITDSGVLHKVNTSTMAAAWTYAAGSGVATSSAYSALRNIIVFASDDLYVHAVNASNGTRLWRVKPTTHDPSDTFTFEGYWPVIAEQHGLVFVRMNLGMAALWSGPGAGHMYPNTNADTRAYLEANPQWQNLFALRLADGSKAFTPAVGYGGVENRANAVTFLEAGPVPVVKTYPDGSEVVYEFFRSGQGNPPDGRWDSHMGEMVLDNTTIPGLVAGDLRFIRWPNSYTNITDEQTPLTMAGNTLFNAHWGASESTRILDRSTARGLSYADPITSQAHPVLIRRMQTCSSFNATTHWTTCGLTLFQDGRYWSGPGWWQYWNVVDPNPTPNLTSSSGILPRYTYVSGGLIIAEGNGGELFVFSHP